MSAYSRSYEKYEIRLLLSAIDARERQCFYSTFHFPFTVLSQSIQKEKFTRKKREKLFWLNLLRRGNQTPAWLLDSHLEHVRQICVVACAHWYRWEKDRSVIVYRSCWGLCDCLILGCVTRSKYVNFLVSSTKWVSQKAMQLKTQKTNMADENWANESVKTCKIRRILHAREVKTEIFPHILINSAEICQS